MKVYAGIDLGGTYIKGGLVTCGGEIVLQDAIPTEAEGGPVHVIDRMALLVRRLIEQDTGAAVAGVGIGVPGQVITDEGLLVEAPNLPGWKNIKAAKEMESRLGLPVVLDNDANAAGLGEYTWGAGRQSRCMLMVTLGTGVGGGLILDGKVYRGVSGGAGEFGHMIVCRDGALCSCGRRGCVEAYVGTRGILRTLERQLKMHPDSPLAAGDVAAVTPKDISAAAAGGDSAALETLAETGAWLGVALGSVANLLNIDRAVVGGGVAGAGDLILATAEKTLKETALKVSGRDIEIVPAKLGNTAGVAGAARLAMIES